MKNNRRYNRIFKNDRAIIAAMDHGTFNGAAKGLEDMRIAINNMKEGGADALLVNMGVAKQYAKELAEIGFVARLDLPPSILGQGSDSRLAYDIEYALKLGADSVIINAGMGPGVEEPTFKNTAKMIMEAHKWGMPVCVEMVPGGFDAAPEYRTLENIRMGCRIASEMGADFIKSPYMPGFEVVAKESFVPIVVLGGRKVDNEKDFVTSIKEAIDSGASGVAIGRNLWGASNPVQMAKAISSIVHGNATAEEACKILEGK
jgi:DhnA family fructose-bisphosphate aldolase class Ia